VVSLFVGLILLCFLQQFENNFELKGQTNTQKWETIFPDEEYIFGDFIERLWAYLTIQELLDKKSVPNLKLSKINKSSCIVNLM